MMSVRLPRLAPAALAAGAVVAAGALVALEAAVGAAAGGAAGAAGLQAAAPTSPSTANVRASREACMRESPPVGIDRPRAKKSRRVIEISRANIHNFRLGAQHAAPRSFDWRTQSLGQRP